MWRVWLKLLSVVLVSRAVVLLGLFFAQKHIPANLPPSTWDSQSVLPLLLRWDSGWYINIGEYGYSYAGNPEVEHNVVFYPLFPLLGRALHAVLGIGVPDALLVVANLAALIFPVILYRVIEQECDAEVAWRALFALFFFPASLFLSAAYTESLFLLGVSIFFACLLKQKFFFAALVAGAVSATRSAGLVLTLPLLWELGKLYLPGQRRYITFFLRAALLMPVAAGGLLLYMAFLFQQFGNPLLFSVAERAWLHSPITTNLVNALLLKPIIEGIFHPRGWAEGFDAYFLLFFFGMTLWGARKLPFRYTLYSLGIILQPYLTVSGSEVVGLKSMNRYLLSAFPVFILLGVVGKRYPQLFVFLLCFLSALLLMFSSLYAQWYWAG